MPDTPIPKVESALFCDGVRAEDNGKHLIIGVYSGGILVESFPASLHLNAYIILALEDGTKGEFPLKLKAKLGDKEIAGMDGMITSMGRGTVPVVLPIPLPEIKQADELQVLMQAGSDEDWSLVLSRPIASPPQTSPDMAT